MGWDWNWNWESYAAEDMHPLFTTTAGCLSRISPAQWCQAFYLMAAGCVLLVASTPAEARGLLVNYGARKATSSTSSTPPPPPAQGKTSSSSAQEQESRPRGNDDLPEKDPERRKNILVSLIASLTSYGQVPHGWFGAFYLVSAACSLAWAAQYYRLVYLNNNNNNNNNNLDGDYNGHAQAWPLPLPLPLHMIATKQVELEATSSVTTLTQAQLFLAWGMLLLQASRRIYEHLAVIRPSKSTMWFVHWVLGLGFYVVTNVAVWVEGSATILSQPPPQNLQSLFLLPDNNIDPGSLIKILIGTPLFLYAWTNQYKTHSHLANLVKYSLPDPQKEPLFKYLISPHYTCECLLYLSIATTAAPKDQYINKTLLCALVFVIVNLGVTAKGTRQWYGDRFGEQAVQGKWNMIPFVF